MQDQLGDWRYGQERLYASPTDDGCTANLIGCFLTGAPINITLQVFHECQNLTPNLKIFTLLSNKSHCTNKKREPTLRDVYHPHVHRLGGGGRCCQYRSNPFLFFFCCHSWKGGGAIPSISREKGRRSVPQRRACVSRQKNGCMLLFSFD